MHGIIAVQISLSYQKPNFGNYFQLQTPGVSAKFLLITTRYSRIIKSYFTLVCLYADERSVGLATSCRWIPKKLPIKVSKSCQKVAIFFQKVAEIQIQTMFSQLALRSARFLPADLCTDHAHYVKNHKSTPREETKVWQSKAKSKAGLFPTITFW